MAKITRIGVLKFALFSTLWAAFIGIIEGIIMSIIALVVPDSINIGGVDVAINIPFVSPFSFITMPLALGIIVFPVSLIIGLIINLVLKIIKGLDLTIVFPEYQQQSQ